MTITPNSSTTMGGNNAGIDLSALCQDISNGGQSSSSPQVSNGGGSNLGQQQQLNGNNGLDLIQSANGTSLPALPGGATWQSCRFCQSKLFLTSERLLEHEITCPEGYRQKKDEQRTEEEEYSASKNDDNETKMTDAPDDADDSIETNKAKQRYAAFLSRMKGEEERKVYNELMGLNESVGLMREIETEKEEQRREKEEEEYTARIHSKKEGSRQKKEEQRTEEEEEDMARQRYAAFLSRMKGEEERKVYNELVGLREIETEKEEQRTEEEEEDKASAPKNDDNETCVPAASSTKNDEVGPTPPHSWHPYEEGVEYEDKTSRQSVEYSREKPDDDSTAIITDKDSAGASDHETTSSFPHVLHGILSNPAYQAAGDEFTIYDPDEFCEKILPVYFKGDDLVFFFYKMGRWGFKKREKWGKAYLIYSHNHEG